MELYALVVGTIALTQEILTEKIMRKSYSEVTQDENFVRSGR